MCLCGLKKYGANDREEIHCVLIWLSQCSTRTTISVILTKPCSWLSKASPKDPIVDTNTLYKNPKLLVPYVQWVSHFLKTIFCSLYWFEILQFWFQLWFDYWNFQLVFNTLGTHISISYLIISESYFFLSFILKSNK